MTRERLLLFILVRPASIPLTRLALVMLEVIFVLVGLSTHLTFVLNSSVLPLMPVHRVSKTKYLPTNLTSIDTWGY